MARVKYFEGYGRLKELSPEEFYECDWRPVGQLADEDGEIWDIVFSNREGEYRYGAI